MALQPIGGRSTPVLTYSGPAAGTLQLGRDGAARWLPQTPGVYTVVCNVTCVVKVRGIAGGGSGGGSSTGDYNGGSGGAGGAMNSAGVNVLLLRNQPYTAVVGAGGPIGIIATGFIGQEGGFTKFSIQGDATIYLLLNGGPGGLRNGTTTAGGTSVTGAGGVSGGNGGAGGTGQADATGAVTGAVGTGTGVPGGGGGGGNGGDSGGAASGGTGGNGGGIGNPPSGAIGGLGGDGRGETILGSPRAGAGGGGLGGNNHANAAGVAGQAGILVFTYVSQR
jgi:hypothetical protein